MPLTADYIAALEQLAFAFAGFRARTGRVAVLVGGAATAIYTDGMFPSGDFDIIAPDDQAFAACMAEHGFRLEDRPGKLLVGWHHPAHPGFGFQQVSGPLFDGRSDENRLLQVIVSAKAEVTLPAIEDLIADRLGQHAVASPTDTFPAAAGAGPVRPGKKP